MVQIQVVAPPPTQRAPSQALDSLEAQVPASVQEGDGLCPWECQGGWGACLPGLEQPCPLAPVHHTNVTKYHFLFEKNRQPNLTPSVQTNSLVKLPAAPPPPRPQSPFPKDAPTSLDGDSGCVLHPSHVAPSVNCRPAVLFRARLLILVPGQGSLCLYPHPYPKPRFRSLP